MATGRRSERSSRAPDHWLAWSLAASTLAHLVALVAVEWLPPPPAPEYVSVRFEARRQSAPTRWPAPARAGRAPGILPQQADLRLAAPRLPFAAATMPPDAASEDQVPGAARGADSALPGEGPMGLGARGDEGWRPPGGEALPAPADLAPLAVPLLREGPQILQDLAEKRTFALIDPRSAKLLRAWLFLPATGACGMYSAAKVLDDLLKGMKRGQATARDVPLEYEVHAVPCGHALRAAELTGYRVVLTDFVGVDSTAALARHLAAGGFALISEGQLRQVEAALQRDGRRRAARVQITADHPLLHAFHDIDPYTFAHMEGVPRPVAGLEIDGRLAAVAGLRYRIERTSGYVHGFFVGAARKPYLSNLLYINALAYGLVQPSAMGGRYLARGGAP